MNRERMRIIDMHSHWGTQRGYPLQSPEELAQQIRVWRSSPRYVTEAEMAEHFRSLNVQAILDLGVRRTLGLDELRALHDYALETQQKYPDVILGNWLHIDPRLGDAGVRELERCAAAGAGFIGLAVPGAGFNIAASDPRYAPLYALCSQARIPVLIFVGYTGLGATLPGGDGVRLEYSHPRHLDEVAATYPGLTLVAARPAWPWQSEMIAVLLHKPNVWYELHGWSPRYFTAELKHEIPRRLQDRVMFGADYPLLPYERLIADWEAEGYSPDVLDKIFYRNAEQFLASLRR
ncbi:MAG TPA: amidohydrolase family protein [candidate division Zixibacteria bacterium]|nr:amidohydrolase family protein [candidate division Zixibacteria bacterium]